MRPLVDDLELPNVQEIKTRERRALAEHKPSGMDGSQLQNMGREPTSVTLCGVAVGPSALEFVEQLDEKFRAQLPISFVADIVADSEIEQMRIDDLKIQDLAGKPQRFAYVLALREHIEPIEPEDTSFLDTDILDDAQDLIDQITAGLDLAPFFSTGLERFVSPFTDMLGGLRSLNQNA
jgi:hypothetical protein